MTQRCTNLPPAAGTGTEALAGRVYTTEETAERVGVSVETLFACPTGEGKAIVRPDENESLGAVLARLRAGAQSVSRQGVPGYGCR